MGREGRVSKSIIMLREVKRERNNRRRRKLKKSK